MNLSYFFKSHLFYLFFKKIFKITLITNYYMKIISSHGVKEEEVGNGCYKNDSVKVSKMLGMSLRVTNCFDGRSHKRMVKVNHKRCRHYISM